jgi:hypothetical protein
MVMLAHRSMHQCCTARGGSAGPLAIPVAFAHYSQAIQLGALMSAIQSKKFAKRFLFVLVAAALSCSVLPHVGYAYTPEEQQACQGDAFRLCGPEIPDVDRVTACMVAKKSQLSPGCAVYFRRGPATKAASSKPRKSRKPAKHSST